MFSFLNVSFFSLEIEPNRNPVTWTDEIIAILVGIICYLVAEHYPIGFSFWELWGFCIGGYFIIDFIKMKQLVGDMKDRLDILEKEPVVSYEVARDDE